MIPPQPIGLLAIPAHVPNESCLRAFALVILPFWNILLSYIPGISLWLISSCCSQHSSASGNYFIYFCFVCIISSMKQDPCLSSLSHSQCLAQRQGLSLFVGLIGKSGYSLYHINLREGMVVSTPHLRKHLFLISAEQIMMPDFLIFLYLDSWARGFLRQTYSVQYSPEQSLGTFSVWHFFPCPYSLHLSVSPLFFFFLSLSLKVFQKYLLTVCFLRQKNQANELSQGHIMIHLQSWISMFQPWLPGRSCILLPFCLAHS